MSVELTPNGTYGVPFPAAPRWVMRIAMALLTLRIRLSGGKVLRLTTTGSKTGQEHDHELRFFQDGSNWLIVASAGGAPKHPAWYYNLARNPDKVWITVEGRKVKVRPESLKGEERDKVYANIVAMAPTFGKYQISTDRVIPVIRLTADEG